MWFGTQDGLNRYDGYQMKVFKYSPSDSNTIQSNSIGCLMEDVEGNIWIGTNAGVDLYNIRLNKFSHFQFSSVDGNKIKSLFQDSEKNVWIGTNKNIVFKYNYIAKKINTYDLGSLDTSEFSNFGIWSILEDNNGKIWIATYGNSLFTFDKKTERFSWHDWNSLGAKTAKSASTQIRRLYKSKNGNIYVATEAGLFLLDPLQMKVVNYYSITNEGSTRIFADRISSIYEDGKDIWIGTLLGGLNKVNTDTKEIVSYISNPDDPFSLRDDAIMCLEVDDNGTLWVGMGNGVDVLFKSANKFSHFKRVNEGTQSINVYSVLVDKNDIAWVGTEEEGFVSYDKNTNQFFSHRIALPVLKNNSVLSIVEDEDGLWLGTWGNGLKFYNTQSYKVTSDYSLPEYGSGTSKGDILSLVSDKNNVLWLGTYGEGIYSFNKKTKEFHHYTKAEGLASDYVYCLYVDFDNRIWIGSEANGLTIYNPINRNSEQFIKLGKEENSISSNAVNCIFKDSKNRIWIGTGAGLNKFDYKTKTFQSYFEKDGLPNDYVYGIMEDKKGNLWLSTNNGISRFNPDAENINGSAFRNYQEGDGLQGKEFNQGAYFKSVSGEMFFGGTNGYNSFYPEKILENSHIPLVYITAIKKFGNVLQSDSIFSEKKSMEFSWKDNFLSFEFVALDYLMPSQNKYSFKLEGVDEDWSMPSNIRFAEYKQLSPGDYTFRVKAANSDGVWNEEGASIKVTIIPPFWRTKWFYSLCVIAFIVGVFGFIRWRTASIKKEKKILEIKVEERTRELAEKNRDITSSIQYAKRIQEAILPPIESIYSHFPDSFILYKPKDIVSGDFYWFAEKNGKKIIAAVDCTGHGVPGAFMSMIGHNLLNQIVVENGIVDPAKILNELHRGVQAALKQGSNVIDTSDGMDVALCCFDEKLSQVTFAGAFRPLFILSENKLERISGNKFSIGGAQLDLSRQFTNHTIFLKNGDKVYMFSDGYADQFGGDKGKKFMLKRFSDILLSFQNTSMSDQKKSLNESIESWSKGFEQVDDVLVIGISV